LIAQAAVTYRLCRRWTGTFQSWILAVSSAVLVLAFMGLELGAWMLAMTLALVAIDVRLAHRPLAAGVVLGLASLARLDVGAYALVSMLLWSHRRQILLAFGAVVVPIALVLVTLVPIAALIEQLVWYPLVGPRQYRGLPGLEAQLPQSLAILFTVVLVLLPRAALAAAVVRSLVQRRRDLLAIAIFGCLCQLQSLGRADPAHLAVATTPAIVVLAALLPKSPRLSVFGAGVMAALMVATSTLGIAAARTQSGSRDVALAEAISVVQSTTKRGDPILVGLQANRYTLVNSLLAYYLADRPPGTRWTMYNPGITNTDRTQTAMVSDLEMSGTGFLILDTEWADAFEIANDSRIPGSAILDDYVQSRFRIWCDFGAYVVAARRTWEPARTCPGHEP
jgi:hypothetical protein